METQSLWNAKKWAMFFLFLLGTLIVAPQNVGASEPPEREPVFVMPPQEPTDVKIGLYLIHVNKISEPSDPFPTMTVEMFMDLQWQDERLAFDPDVVGVDKKVYLEHDAALELDQIWWPDIEVENEEEARQSETLELIIFPNGMVEYEERFNVVVSTKMDLLDFPFDKQVFEVDLESSAWDENYLRLTANEEKIGWEETLYSPEWTYTDYETEIRLEKEIRSPDSFHEFIYKIYASRQTGFYVWKLATPFMIVVVMTWALLWIEGEKIFLRMRAALIGVVSVVTFHRILAGFLPRISFLTLADYVIIISYLFTSAVIIELTILHQLQTHNREALALKVERIGRWLIPIGYFVVLGLMIASFLR
ncbi:MAG: hypothetical protein GY943_08275 [Chloroflexi bacterium]|nr:hypothetical protein [Chloroflexota bacterium]